MDDTNAPEGALPRSPVGLSVFEQRLYGQLADHVAAEADHVARYRAMAENPGTPESARFLLRLVIDDEERHHRLFRQIALAVGNGIAWRDDSGSVPGLTPWEDHPELLEATEQFLDAEREDRKQLHEMRKELRPMRDTSLWPLLLELMERDSEKHILMLGFIKEHVAHRSVH